METIEYKAILNKESNKSLAIFQPSSVPSMDALYPLRALVSIDRSQSVPKIKVSPPKEDSSDVTGSRISMFENCLVLGDDRRKVSSRKEGNILSIRRSPSVPGKNFILCRQPNTILTLFWNLFLS